MSKPYYKKSSTTRKKEPSKDVNVRVMVKFGWNGNRIPVPSNYKITTRSSLMHVMECIQTSLPTVIFEGLGMKESQNEPTLLHMRNCVKRSQWINTTLKDVGVEEGSALLTLNLSGVIAPNMNVGLKSAKPSQMKTNDNSTTIMNDRMMPASTSTSQAPNNVLPTYAIMEEKNSMEVEKPTKQSSLSCEKALDKLITSHFDADSQDCVKTLIKVIDNIIHKPGEPKTRSIRLQNAAFWKKVGSKSGGVEFLLACGFTPNTPILSNPSLNQNITLILEPHNESSTKLYSARKLLQKCALDLGISSDDIAPLRKPTPLPSLPSSNSTTTSKKTFDPFQAHSFNVQAASVGAPNPNGITPDGSKSYISNTERELDKLNQKAKQMEKDMQKKPLMREWAAFLPGQQQQHQQISVDLGTNEKGKGDGALLAQRMKRMEEERKKREEGGFTTKAMRDLEKMKKAKLFTHAQLRICFPDGLSISGNFYPNEKIETVQKLIIEETLIADPNNRYSFDLYVTPPRRVLPAKNTLVEEGLLPAARVFVSWKNGTTPPPGVSYIKPELLGVSTTPAFPNSKALIDGDDKKKNIGGIAKKKNSGDKRMSEEELMNRMMGGGKRLGRTNNSSANTEKKSSSSSKGGFKPAWFKK